MAVLLPGDPPQQGVFNSSSRYCGSRETFPHQNCASELIFSAKRVTSCLPENQVLYLTHFTVVIPCFLTFNQNNPFFSPCKISRMRL